MRFVLALALFGALVALLFRDAVLGTPLIVLREFTAGVTLDLVRLLGIEAVREGSALYHSGGFAYQISRGCMGLVPAGFLATGILAYPAPPRIRAWALMIGLPVILGLNLVRLVHLFYLGVERPELFRPAHGWAWETVMVLAVVVIWLGFAVRADGRGSDAAE